MMRLYLCIEDQPAPGGYIIHSPDPSGVTYMMYEHHVAYIGSEAHCNACNSKGLIAKAGGPRRPIHMEREIALNHDILHCLCAKPPLMIATAQSCGWFDDMAETYGTLPLTSVEGKASTAPEEARSGMTRVFDEQIVVDANDVRYVARLPYLIETTDGRCGNAVLQDGQLPRVSTDLAAAYTVYWGDDALERGQP